MPDGYAVYSSSIIKWETEPGPRAIDEPPIDEAERQRIAANIRRYFEDRGRVVYVS